MKDAAPFDPKHVSLLWAGPDRAAEIAHLHQELFDPSWDEASVASLLDHPASTAFVAVVGSPRKAVGFILGQIAADEAEILSMGVAKANQRRGLGRRLVEGLMRAVKRSEGRKLHLEVAADNAAALGLYRGLGFKLVGRREGYYARKGAPAVDAINLSIAL
jgi:[ribosomal protein S18]-alanine N-acetyltransferase